MSRFPDTPEDVDEAEALPDEQPVNGASSFSGRLPLVGAVILAVVAEVFLGAALVLTGSHLSLVEVGVPIISGFFALGTCLLAGLLLRGRGRERGAWAVMGLACLGVLVAQGAQLLPASLSSRLPLTGSYPSVATVALIAQNVLLFLAFLLFPAPATERATLRHLRQFFDGVLVVGSALIGAGYFILLPLLQGPGASLDATRLTTLAICVADGLLLAGVLFAMRSPAGRGNPLSGALRLLALGALLLIAADAASLIRHPAQPAAGYSWLQVVWNAGYLCLGLGAMLRLRGESRSDVAGDGYGQAAPRPSLWLTAPFALTVVVAGAIMLRALMENISATQMLAAVVCVSLLVALIGTRHLVGVFEAHRLGVEGLMLSHDVALAAQEIDRLQDGLLAESEQRQAAIAHIQDILTHVSYGAYHLRVEALGGDLVPLSGALNMLLEGLEQQRSERDRVREARLIRTLADALGRLALGELHDLPSLPSPAGTGGIDDLIRGAIQVRSRLLSMQEQAQLYETNRLELEQQIVVARHQLEEDEQARKQTEAQVHQSVEDHWQVEYQVAQATQDQLRRDLQWTQERLRAAEEQARAADAALQTLEAKARQERLSLERERVDLEERLRAEREALEELRQQAPAPAAALPTERLREQGERLARQLEDQAERLHIAAASLQTAAEVARRLSRALEETAASADLRGLAAPAAPARVVDAQPAPAVTKQLSAMQMLEKLAGLRTGDTAPQPVVTPATSIPPSSSQQSGPLGEGPGERVARRLQGAAGRAEEIATGLLDLARQFIATGEETARTAEEAHHLVAELEPAVQVPTIIPKTTLPPRQPKARR